MVKQQHYRHLSEGGNAARLESAVSSSSTVLMVDQQHNCHLSWSPTDHTFLWREKRTGLMWMIVGRTLSATSTNASTRHWNTDNATAAVTIISLMTNRREGALSREPANVPFS
ncbi:hypothetical protein DPEC_G00257520 [Dallia pectoralis]|uniref:Uncharacterized protein n=1 Tax=Dallia pectoralis TaxID=75939 RepID=A0ACC2FQW1_DALPE|nr:hypothetical protein DPEC_G00257520 [Dallia pectoralis]